MASLKHSPGPPMTLGNIREQGVHHLIAFARARIFMNQVRVATEAKFRPGRMKNWWRSY
jgi:hypothetical protein